MEKNGQKLWGNILTGLRSQVTLSTFKTWFAGSYVVDFKQLDDKNLLVVGLKNSFLKEQVEARYLAMISAVKNEKGYGDIEVVFKVAQSKVQEAGENAPLFTGQAQNLFTAGHKAEALNPNYLFSNYIVGPANNLAYVAAAQAASDMGRAYNPLLVFGPTGVGKTHLLQAIGNQVIDKTINAKVLYVTAEKFTNDFLESLNNRTTQFFRQKYRGVDLLIVDDIQFIAGKESTQDEFFHCLNELTISSKQVVAASDKHPKDLGKLKDRITSRFLGGMIADIGYPDLEMKIAILRTKSRERNVFLDDELISVIARESHGGARELEGVLTAALAQIRISGGKIKNDVIRSIISKNDPGEKPLPSVGVIFREVSRRYKFSEETLKGSSRKASLVKARQVLMYLLRNVLGLPLASIGDLIGGRDHSTVIHSIEKVEEAMRSNANFKDDILGIKSSVHNS